MPRRDGIGPPMGGPGGRGRSRAPSGGGDSARSALVDALVRLAASATRRRTKRAESSSSKDNSETRRT